MSEHNYRRKLQEYEAPYQQQDWKKMQGMLSQAGLRKGSRVAYKYWGLLALALLLTTLLLWPSEKVDVLVAENTHEIPVAAQTHSEMLSETPLQSKIVLQPSKTTKNTTSPPTPPTSKQDSLPRSSDASILLSRLDSLPKGLDASISGADSLHSDASPLLSISDDSMGYAKALPPTLGQLPQPDSISMPAPKSLKPRGKWQLRLGLGLVFPTLPSDDKLNIPPFTVALSYAATPRLLLGAEVGTWKYTNNYRVATAETSGAPRVYKLSNSYLAKYWAFRADYAFYTKNRFTAYIGAKVGHYAYRDSNIIRFNYKDATFTQLPVNTDYYPPSSVDIDTWRAARAPLDARWIVSPQLGMKYQLYGHLFVHGELALRPSYGRLGIGWRF